MADSKLDLPQGTLDLRILKALSLEPMRGWAMSQRIQQLSRDTLQISQGSLYPALHRLERKGWVKAPPSPPTRGTRTGIGPKPPASTHTWVSRLMPLSLSAPRGGSPAPRAESWKRSVTRTDLGGSVAPKRGDHS